MTEENTGITNNQAEILKDYNIIGVSDKDSIPNNKDSKEDDMSSADIIIGVQTGNSLIYISIVTVLIIALIIVFAIAKRTRVMYKIVARFGKEV